MSKDQVPESVLRKISGLLAAGSSSGQFADEASAFLAKARELMIKYQLTEGDVEVVDRQTSPGMTSEWFDLGVKKHQPVNWRRDLARTIATFTDVKMHWAPGWPMVRYIGRTDDVSLAIEMYNWIAPQIVSHSDVSYPGRGDRRSWRYQFCEGAVDEIENRLWEIKHEQDSAPTTAALVLVKADAIMQYLEATNSKPRSASSWETTSSYNRAARRAGANAAKNIDITPGRKQLEG